MEQAFSCRIFKLGEIRRFRPMCGTYIMWLWLDVFLVLLNGDVLVGVVAFSIQPNLYL